MAGMAIGSNWSSVAGPFTQSLQAVSNDANGLKRRLPRIKSQLH